SAVSIYSLGGGFSIFQRTLSRLKGNKPLVAYVARIFHLVINLSLIGLYSKLKYSLLTISKPP
ncbi:hypothetical protein P154DRAFT_589520, partial [Amniculicola lignicola CBS 123094]